MLPPPKEPIPEPPPEDTSATKCSLDNNRGKVDDVILGVDGLFFKLSGVITVTKGVDPTNGYYIIDMEHPNYNLLANSIVSAGAGSCILKVKCAPITGTPHARVEYIEIDNMDGGCFESLM